MKSKFSTSWKSSKQPRKQRKYVFNMPIHLRGKLLSVHLTPALREKYHTRSTRVRKGDKVKVVKGQFKGKSGKVESVDTTRLKVIVSGINFTKKDGSKGVYPIAPANLIIEDLDTTDKRRFEVSAPKEKAKKEVKAEKPKAPKSPKKKEGDKK
jgi:large subunit ribosomal protein L24